MGIRGRDMGSALNMRRLGIVATAIVGALGYWGVNHLQHRSLPAIAQTLPSATCVALSDGRTIEIGDSRVTGVVTEAVVTSADAQSSKRVPLLHPRRLFSATAMPDGRVLIWGGVDEGGRVVSTGEWFDPQHDVLSAADLAALTPRAAHTATVLTDGSVLFTGGLNSKNRELKKAEIFDPVANTVKEAPASRGLGRNATLLSDGRVLLESGYDAEGNRIAQAVAYDPRVRAFTDVPQDQLVTVKSSSRASLLAETIPGTQTQAAPLNKPIALRFSAPMDVKTLNDRTVSLLGPQGPTPIKVNVVDGGRLAFVTPSSDLLPGFFYALYLNGLHAEDGAAVPMQTISFDTATIRINETEVADSSSLYGEPIREVGYIEDSSWHPGKDSLDGHWRVNKPIPPQLPLSALNGTVAQGKTTLYGQVLLVDDRPVVGAEVTVADRTTKTDARGLFVLTDLPEGRQEIFVDGSKVNNDYGQVVLGATLEKSQVNKLPQQIFLPKINPADRVRVSAPTNHEVVLTHPELPGLEIHIPAGSVIRDHNGHIVNELALVPTPLDRPPYPVPDNFPAYFTLQPGGATILGVTPQASRGARVVYPNYSHAKPGTSGTFWVYDPAIGWKTYGHGDVSADGKHVIPDSNVVLYAATSTGMGLGNGPPGGPPGCGGAGPGGGSGDGGSGSGGGGSGGGGSGGGGGGAGGSGGRGGGPGSGAASAGDPCELATGLFKGTWTDMSIDDVMPLRITRYYRENDAVSRSFGYGMNHDYGMYLYDPDGTSNTPQLVLPDGETIGFTRTSGSGGSGTWTYSASPNRFFGATLYSTTTYVYPNFLYTLVFGDGTRWIFNGSHYIYNRQNVLLRIEDRYGNQIKIDYDDAVRVSKVTSPSGRWITFGYDGNNRVSNVTDHTGRTVGYSYNAIGTLDTVTYADQTTEHYTYYPDTKSMHTRQDRNGNIALTNEYDAANRLSKQTLADGAVYTFYNYVTDSNGHVAQVDIDYPQDIADTSYPRIITRRVSFTNGAVTTDVWGYGQADDQTWTFARDPNTGLLLSKTDPLQRVTKYEGYDARGNVGSVTLLYGTSDAVTYNFTYTPDYGDLATITDPLGHTTAYSYTNGCLTKINDPLGHSTNIVCNGSGQPISIQNALGHSTQLGYSFYDLSSVTDALGRTTNIFRDNLARVLSVQDPAGNFRSARYDVNDRLSSFTDALGSTVQVGYDNNGNLTSVTDLLTGSAIGFGYDHLNRKTSRTDPFMHGESWTYDGLGHVHTYTDRNGQVTTSTPDDLGRPSVISFADSSSITYHYDAAGRVSSIVDSLSGTITPQLDGLNRLTSEQTPQGTITYHYDTAGRRHTMQVTGQPLVTYIYDDANRIKSLSTPSEAIGYDYDDANRRKSITLPNGVQTQYGFDEANRLRTLTYVTGNNASLGNLVYTYDNADHIASTTGSWASDALPSATASDYQYDAGNRLTAGNAIAPIYDPSGQMTQDGSGKIYTWNARHQLVQISQGASVIATFIYDAIGRRSSKTVGSATTQYLHDGMNPVAELVPNNTNFMLMGRGIDERYARTDATGRLYYLKDGLGSTIALLDGSANIKQRYAYDPYGGATSLVSNANVTNPYTYTGREDDGTGLYYYRARYYSPLLSRFTSEDPIGLAGGPNPYSLVGDDPISLSDPFGLCAKYAMWTHSVTFQTTEYETDWTMYFPWPYIKSKPGVGAAGPEMLLEDGIPIEPELTDIGSFWITFHDANDVLATVVTTHFAELCNKIIPGGCGEPPTVVTTYREYDETKEFSQFLRHSWWTTSNWPLGGAKD